MQIKQSSQPLATFILPFLDYCEVEKGLSDNTQRTYGHYLQLFVRLAEQNRQHHAPPPANWPSTSGTIASTSPAATRTQRESISKKTQNNYLIALRALLDFLAERNIDTLPSSKVKLARHKDETPFPFSIGAT